MANITFELKARNEAETKAKQLLTHGVAVWKDRGDCRNLLGAVKEVLEECGVPAEIGCGGSHIWIHRADEHRAGNPPGSQRWAIITD